MVATCIYMTAAKRHSRTVHTYDIHNQNMVIVGE